MEKTKNLFIDIVKEDSNPALGCTEPVAVAPKFRSNISIIITRRH